MISLRKSRGLTLEHEGPLILEFRGTLHAGSVSGHACASRTLQQGQRTLA